MTILEFSLRGLGSHGFTVFREEFTPFSLLFSLFLGYISKLGGYVARSFIFIFLSYVWVYYYFLTILVSFFTVNLCLAVIQQAYVGDHEEEEINMEAVTNSVFLS